MYEFAHYLEFYTKLLYGTHLTASFSGLTLKKNKKEYINLMLLVSILLNLSYFVFGESFTLNIYFFLIHMPIIIFINKKMSVSLFHSTLSIILAFQLLSCRVWLGEFFNLITLKTALASDFFIVLLTFPLAFLFGKYLAPPIVKLKEEPKLMLVVSVIPITYYLIIGMMYFFNFYEYNLFQTNEYLFNFIDAWFSIIFIIYTLISLRIFDEKKQTDIDHEVLISIKNYTQKNLSQLKKQYELEVIHRHDMRHHGNYILSLLPNDTDENIINYIKSVMINPDVSNDLISNDETLNLVLNYYKQKCNELKIPLYIKINVEDYSNFSTINLCSLLSNGLENSVKATKDLPEEQRKISLKMQSKKHSLSIDLRNSYFNEPKFVNDLPVALEKYHGYGTKSMLRICQKYNGITRFYTVDNEFRFQTMLQNIKLN